MQIGEILKDSLKFPIDNLERVIIIGVLSAIVSIIGMVSTSDYGTGIVFLVLGIISLIIMFIINGYLLSVIKNTLMSGEIAPELEIEENLTNGIKLFVISLIYFIIPTIILIIIGFVSGLFSTIIEIFSEMAVSIDAAVATNTTAVASSGLSDALIYNFMVQSIIFFIIALIMLIIVLIFYNISMCRLADKKSIGYSLSFKGIINDIKRIGFLNYIGKGIVLYLVIIIISFIFGLIVGALSGIPYMDIIIPILYGLIITPYLTIVGARGMALIYKND